jgi:hypothetical protein
MKAFNIANFIRKKIEVETNMKDTDTSNSYINLLIEDSE